MSTLIWQRFEFDSGHRVLGHQGKCRHLHGHRYNAEVGISAYQLDGLSMVVDFSEVKKRIGTWIDEQWDHNTILNRQDPLCGADVRMVALVGRVPYLMPKGNPTAENLAMELFGQAVRLLETHYHHLRVEEVVIWETPNCRAQVSRKGWEEALNHVEPAADREEV